MIKSITYKVFIEQIQRRIQNDFPSSESTVTANEIALYVYQAIATAITQASERAFAVDGIHSAPEGFITTFKFPPSAIKKDYDTGCYEVTLPHPPVNLPLGYSIMAPYFTERGQKTYPVIWINSYHKSYALKLATPDYGIYCEAEGDKLIFTCPDYDLINSGMKLFVPMLSPRGSGNDTDTINVADDVLAFVFDAVVARMTQRVATPKDTINDGANKRNEP